VNVAYASGHFKQTAKYAYVEAFANIIISIVLVRKYGLIGVAIGTMISMVYRMIAHVWYLKNNILFRPFKKWVKSICVFSAAFILSFIIGKIFLIHEVGGYSQWFEMAICVAIASMIIFSVFSMLFYKEYFIKLIGKMTKKA
jgi:peptidoglycan biosynthesis protein MviN/MurJ (putative lipid II flippase)